MTKIVVDSAIPFIRDRFPENVEITYIPGKEFTPEIVKDADAIIVRTRTKCDKNLLEESSVQVVSTATIGTDHIDIPWCEKSDIVVRNAPGCNAPGVAQYVFSSLFKNGFDPKKHVLGIIGYGNVGHIVEAWAKEMGVKTLVNDPPRNMRGEKDTEYQELEYVLKNSDAVTLHVPLSKTGENPTYKLIGDKELEMMKPGSTIVNTSRGGVVDEKALIKVLKEEKIKAIVDVWENEPDIDEELARLVSIATPHIAGYSEEGKRRATRMAIEAVSEVLGLPVNLSGLECIPPTNIKISKDLIEGSYNPDSDKEKLLSDISRFEDLRNHYVYRHEPLFTVPQQNI